MELYSPAPIAPANSSKALPENGNRFHINPAPNIPAQPQAHRATLSAHRQSPGPNSRCQIPPTP